MSREIKFRGWVERDGVLLGSRVYTLDEIRLLEDQAPETSTTRIMWDQYTGLKDKNGKEIYEGDIVRVNGEIALNDDIVFNPIAKIVWVDSAAGFGEKFTIKEAPMVPFGMYKYEVIGSIHENPELLGGEE